ncbi:MAG TPA: recombinase family protein [Dehalococcoidia bacterium]
MKAAGYFRQPAAEKSGEALGRQQRDFLDVCDRQGYEVAATFAEESHADDTPAFGQLIDFLRKPEKGFVVVVVASPEVLADDVNTAAARFLEIESLGGRVEFLLRGSDAMSTLMESWTKGQSEGMSARVRSAMRRKAVKGEILGRPPYGYKVGQRNRLELVPEESVVVRYIFRLYLHEGLGIRLIARRLNEEGLRTRRERPWSMVSIRDILRNRAYLGTYQRLGVRVPGTHPALVSPEDFRRVEERLSDRRTNYSPRSVQPFLLSGLAHCANCGNRMIGVSRRQSWKRRTDGTEMAASYRYYQCESRTNQGICSYHTHRAEDLEDTVRRHLAEIDPRTMGAAGDDAAVLAEWQAQAKRLRERLHLIDRRIGRSLEAASAARLSRDKLRTQGLAMAQERLKTEDELRAAQWRAENYASASERRRARAAALAKLVQRWEELPTAEHQELLRDLIDRIIVSDDAAKLLLRP